MRCCLNGGALLLMLLCAGDLPAQKAAAALYDPDKLYTVQELHADLAILKDALVKVHPGLFWHQPEKEFEENYARLRTDISSPRTERQFLTLLTAFVANIKCSHTDLVMSEAFDRYLATTHRYFPFGVKIIPPKLYLTANCSSDSTLRKGTELVAINGISADSLLRFMRPYAWADGFTPSCLRIEGDFDPLIYIHGLFNRPENYVVSIIDPASGSRTVEVPALDHQTLEARFLQHTRGQEKALQPFRFRMIDSLHAGVMMIDEFEGRGYASFLRRSFRQLKQARAQNLVIDLRGNGGGEDYYARLLYAYIALKEYSYYKHLEVRIHSAKDPIFRYGKRPLKFYYRFGLIKKTGPGTCDLRTIVHPNLSNRPFRPHKNNFTGRVYVLTDAGSFSVTSEFCAVAQYNRRATFIGRETGGGSCGNTSGDEFLLTLPRTGIRISIPVIRYCMAVEGPCGRGICPDHPLKEDISDLLLNKDSDLQFALDLIQKSR